MGKVVYMQLTLSKNIVVEAKKTFNIVRTVCVLIATAFPIEHSITSWVKKMYSWITIFGDWNANYCTTHSVFNLEPIYFE